MGVDDFRSRWGGGDDGTFALGFIAAWCGCSGGGLWVDRAFLGEECGRLIFDRVVEGFERVVEVV